MSWLKDAEWVIELDADAVDDRCSELAAKASQLYHHRISGYVSEADLLFCPACTTRWNLWGIMFHLNDNHNWSREDIADFLDTLPYDLTVVHPNPDRA